MGTKKIGTKMQFLGRNAFVLLVTFMFLCFAGPGYVYADNIPPTAVDDTKTTDEDTSVNINVILNDTDVDGTIDPETVLVTSGPAHGMATVNLDGTVDYAPAENYNGPDSFTYTVNDNEGATSNVATVSITVTPVNDPPIAIDDLFTVLEDSTNNTLDVLKNDTDPDLPNDTLTITWVDSPSHDGEATTDGTTVTYTPAAGFNGQETFTYTIRDVASETSSATVTVNVFETNETPVARNDYFAMYEDTVSDPSWNVTADNLAGPDELGDEPSIINHVSDPNNGTLVLNADGTFTYTPFADWRGDDTFTYNITDDDGEVSNTATVYITVLNTNDTPVAHNDDFGMQEDSGTLNGSVLGENGHGADELGDTPSTVTQVGDVSDGALALNGDGTFEYTPDLNFNGEATFTYNITDQDETSNTATVTINVVAVNDPPVALADSYSTPEETPLTVAAPGVLNNDNDVDAHDVLEAVRDIDVSNGTLTLNTDGSFTYTPNDDFYGPDSFTYHAFDGIVQSNIVTVTIAVDNLNDAPVATADSYSTDEDDYLTVDAEHGVLSNDTDADGDDLTAMIDTTTSNGVLVLAGDGSFFYAPYDDFNGTDTFTYHAFDGEYPSSTVTVTITVNNVNDAPVANTDTVTVDEDSGEHFFDVLANDMDADFPVPGDTKTITSVVPPPANEGTAEIDGNQIKFIPAADFNGLVTFTYTMEDSEGASSSATVNVTVTNINDPPLAYDDPYTVDEDSGEHFFDVLANDTDADFPVPGDTKTIMVVDTPDNGGTAVIDGNQIRYSPAGDFNGTETFTYTMQDGEGASDTATVTVIVDNINDAPVANTDNFDVLEDSTDNILDVLDNDTDADLLVPGDTLTITSVTTPDNGGAATTDGTNVTYTPADDFNGIETFSYTIQDETGAQSTATVNVTVENDNDPPVANNDAYTVDEDSSNNPFDVLANDTDADFPVPGDTKTITVVSTPNKGGTAVIDGDQIKYSPATDFNGTETFTYTIEDSQGASDDATVTVTVTNINDAPIAQDDLVTTNEETAIQVMVMENDYLGDLPTTVTNVWPAGNGTVTFDATSTTYTPDVDFVGTDVYNYQITDGDGSTDIGTVIVTVEPVDPIAADDNAETDEGTPVVVDVLDNDFLGLNLPTIITAVTQGANGTVTFTNDSTTYTPIGDFNGTDSYTYTITDNNGESSTATVTVTVNNVNDAPVAVDDSFTVDKDSSNNALDVLANDTDVDLPDDTLTITVVTPASNGTVTINSSKDGLLYTPNEGYVGSDSFTYTVEDAAHESSTASVTITVNPLVFSPEFTSTPGTAATVDLEYLYRITVEDPDSDTLTITGTILPAWLTLSDNGDGTGYLFGTPGSGDVYDHPVELVVTDDDENFDTQSFTITVYDLVLIPQDAWTLWDVDSEELVGEDGAAVNAFDGDPNTIWHTEWYGGSTPPPHEIQIDLGAVYDIDGLHYLPRQDYSTNGRIKDYEFYVSADGIEWGDPVVTGTFANTSAEQEQVFSRATGQYIRLVALNEVNNNPWTAVAELNLIGAPYTGSENDAPDGTIDLPVENELTIMIGDSVDFAGTGTDPENDTPFTYLWDFVDPAILDSTDEDPGLIQFNAPGSFTVTFTVTDVLGLSDPTPATRTINVVSDATWIPQDDWTLWYVDSEEVVGEDGAAVNAFDGDPNTIWHTEWLGGSPPPPHEIQINLGAVYDIEGFRYLPRPDTGSSGAENGRIREYEFYVSSNGMDWGSPVATGIFANTAAAKERTFPRISGQYQYVRLVALSEVNNNPWTTMAELNVLGIQTGTGNYPPDGAIDLPVDNPVNIWVGESVYFAGTGTDPENDTPFTYLWNFGDPAIADSTSDVPGLIQFNAPGSFTVTFTVTDVLGLSDATPATRTINVVSDATWIPQDDWTLWYVDSEEVVGEDGAAVNAFDGDPNTIWHTEWLGGSPPPPHEIQINLGAVYDIEGFQYLPRQNSENGRIKDFEFYVSLNGSTWGSPVATGTFANTAAAQERTFTRTSGQFIRLVALSEVNDNAFISMGELNILGIQTGSGNLPPDGFIDLPVENVTIMVGGFVEFAGYGTDPENDIPFAYLWNFGDPAIDDSTDDTPGLIQFNSPGTFTVTFTVTDAFGFSDPTPATRVVNVNSDSTWISQDAWSLWYVDSEELTGEDGAAVNAFDGDPNTIWHTEWYGGSPTPPHEIQIYLGDVYDIEGFEYLPRPDTGSSGAENGRIREYEFYVSLNGTDWGSPVAIGTFENTAAAQDRTFARTRGQYIRLVALSEVNNNPWTAVAELNLYAGPVQTSMVITPEEATVMTGGTLTFSASDGKPPYTFSLQGNQSGGSIEPDGLYTAGPTYGVTDTVRVTDSTLAWMDALVDVVGPVGITPQTVYVAISGTVSFTATGGVPPYTFSLPDSPSGGSIVPDTGLYTAGPNSGVSDTVRVTDSTFTTADATVTVVDMPVAISPTGITVPILGTRYFTATGGVPPYTFSLPDSPSGGSIVPGTGLYTAGSTYGVTDTVRVTDNGGDTAETFVVVVDAMIVLDQANWTVHFVDSEELIGEDGAAENAFDGDVNTIWHTEWYQASPEHPHEIQIDLGDVYEIDGFRYLPRQDQSTGRISLYEFYVSMDGVEWGNPVATGFFDYFAVGEQEVMFSRVPGQYIRFVALNGFNGEAWTTVAEINLLGAPFSGNYAPDSIIDTPGSNLTIVEGGSVDFAGTGTDPENNTPFAYLWNFGDPAIDDSTDEDPGRIQFDTPGTYLVTFTVTDSLEREDRTPATRIIKVIDGGDGLIPHDTWTLLSVDSEEVVGEDGKAVNAFDGDPDTLWHTEWYESEPPPPHQISIDLGSAYLLDGFRYLPRQDSSNGRIASYHVYVSADGRNWGSAVASGTFAGDNIEKRILFAPKWGQFVRLVGVTEVNGGPCSSSAELNTEGAHTNPYVKIIDPQTGDIQQGPDLIVRASVCLNSSLHAGWGVKFTVDDNVAEQQVVVLPESGVIESDTFTARFSGVGFGEHIVEAVIVDNDDAEQTGETAYDVAYNVALGDYYVAVGDSITVGYMDDDPFDDVSQDGRNVGGGFTPVLNDLLTAAKGYPHTVVNEGLSGEKTREGLARLPSVLDRYPHAQYFLVLYGTIDLVSDLPSGQGLSPGDPGYANSFKDLIQQMIDLITDSGKTAYLGKLLYSTDAEWNATNQIYNLVIDELCASNGIPVTPPPFYDYFEENQGELIDGSHPSGEGYRSMARLWFEALTSPVANDDIATTDEETPVSIDVVANDTDPDGTIDVTTVVVVTGPDYGTAIANADGTVDYTPDAGFTGPDTFTYTVDDDEGNTSNEATVTVTVNPV